MRFGKRSGRNRSVRTGAVVAALALAVSACGGGSGGEPGAAQIDSGDAEALGGQAGVDELTRLYDAAMQAGQDTVVIYGPGVEDREPAFEQFEERFPGIDIQGEYLSGPQLTSKVDQEFASGQHVADVIHTGDTSVAPQIQQDRFEKFSPVTAEGLDPQFKDPEGYVHSEGASTFGILYNTDEVSAGEAPKSWEDLTDPKWKGKMVWEDPTSFGATFGAVSHWLYGGLDTGFLEQLAGQDIHRVASAPEAGAAVARGEFAVVPAYPYSFYARDKDKGAPIGFSFPVEGGNHLSPHYLGLVTEAPHPDAAKLLITWLFTPEGQQATADSGYYPTMPDGPTLEDYPPVNELELLKPFPMAEVNAISDENLATVKGIFGD